MPDRVADRIGYILARLVWHLDVKRKAAAGATSLPLEQWRVLELLHDRGGRSVGDLAQASLIEVPTLSKMIDRMVTDALVYRAPDAHDRRRVLIFLSDHGRSRFDALLPMIEAEERDLAQRLGQAGLAALRRLSADLETDARQLDLDSAARKVPGPGRFEAAAADTGDAAILPVHWSEIAGRSVLSEED